MSCIVKSCNNYKTRRPAGISFHWIPRDQKVQKQWLKVLGLERENFVWSEHKFICSNHFLNEDFTEYFGKRTLKKNSVPSQHLEDDDFNEQDSAAEVIIIERVQTPNPSTDFSASTSTTNDSKELSFMFEREDHHSTYKQEKFSNFDIDDASSISNDSQFGINFDCSDTKNEYSKISNNEIIKCRTCLSTLKEEDCVNITEICYLHQTVKQAILRVVPEMYLTLQDNEMVCKKCVKTLKSCLMFIRTCLTVEMVVMHNKIFTSNIDVNDVIDKEDEEFEKIIIEVEADHNYCVKEDMSDCISISSAEDGNAKYNLETKDVNTTDNKAYQSTIDPASALAVLCEESPLSVQNGFIDTDLLDSLKIYTDLSTQHIKKEYTRFRCSIEDSDRLQSLAVHTDLPTQQKKRLRKDDQKKLTCSICSLKFDEAPEYEKHKKYHNICKICQKDFPDKNEFDIHVKEHKANYQVCEFCGKILKTANSLRVHIATVHEDCSAYMCDRCPKMFKNKLRLNIHVKVIHEKAKRCQCPVCGKFFLNAESCKLHHRVVHLKLTPFLCSICGKKFGRRDYLKRHQLRHAQPIGTRKLKRMPRHGICLKSTGKPVNCPLCDKKIITVHNLKMHLESHVKIKRFKCKYCDLSFSLDNNKKRHEKQHEMEPVNKFRCNICWKKVPTKEELETHVNSHDRPPQYQCDMCDERFHRRYLLDNHIAEKHISDGDIEKAVEEIVVKNLLEYCDPRIPVLVSDTV